MNETLPLWIPSAVRKERAVVTQFQQWLAAERGLKFTDYESFWNWSVNDLEGFWGAVWQFFSIPTRRPFERVLATERMPSAQWFIGVELNFVDQIFRHANLSGPAILFESESSGTGEISWPQLQRDVAAFAQTLRKMGVVPGDRVVGYLPNIYHTTVAFLAAASLGAIWSVCSPDMGPVSLGDRFRQIDPKVLIACDGYRFAGKAFDRRSVLEEVLPALPSLSGLVWVNHLEPGATPPPAANRLHVVGWEEALHEEAPWEPASLPGDHPLWILYSSGTTGLPKPIVHSHAGVLANGLVNMVLHNDLQPGDRVLWPVSTSWMVWNAHVMSLLGGASIVLYDGSVTGVGTEPDWAHLWKLAGRYHVTFFGAGAGIHHSAMKAGIVPREVADLSALKTVSSTGSPLVPEAYSWLYQTVKDDIWLNCVSGGTDIAAGFLVGLPTLPVYEGEMQCRALGASVHTFNDDGHPVIDEVGELVCTRPLPSMPLFFWGDIDGSRYLESYFDSFSNPTGANVWRHGDWMRLLPRPEATGGIIYGRSDATINRQGVRMGTAELYRAVEGVTEILDSLVIDLEYLGRESYMVLFVVLRPGLTLSPSLDELIRKEIRRSLSARHIPNDIVQVQEVPKTRTGKKLELPVKKLMLGHPVEKVVNRDSMVNPASIDWYIEFSRKLAPEVL